MARWLPKSVAQGTVSSEQVLSILVDNIWEKAQVTYSKYTQLYRNGLGLFRGGGGKSSNEKYL